MLFVTILSLINSFKIFREIYLLTGDHPEAIDCKRIKAKHADYYRIRIGKYRVIYTIIGRQIVVVNTLLAGSRGDVYKKMGGMK